MSSTPPQNKIWSEKDSNKIEEQYTKQVRALKLRKLQLEVQYFELKNAKLEKDYSARSR